MCTESVKNNFSWVRTTAGYYALPPTKGPKGPKAEPAILGTRGKHFWQTVKMGRKWDMGHWVRAASSADYELRSSYYTCISIFNQSAHHFPSSVLLWLRLKESENMTVALEFRTFAVTALGFLGFYFTIKMLTGKRKGELNTQNSQAQWRTCRLIQEGLAPTLRVRSPPENRTRTTYSESLQLPL